LWVAFQTGLLTVEAYKRRKARKGLDVDAAAVEMGAARAAGDLKRVSAVMAKFEFGPIIGPVAHALPAPDMTRTRALKLFADAERRALRRLDLTRFFIRVGPILGLMGTLIPISPALVGLARGDTQTLSANLIVAFSTTVVGLLIGSTAYFVSLVRERMYAQDIADLQYVLEGTGGAR
jgi:biopolymer transport protein ExbB/TolQ